MITPRNAVGIEGFPAADAATGDVDGRAVLGADIGPSVHLVCWFVHHSTLWLVA
jgi:hypothetical protein